MNHADAVPADGDLLGWSGFMNSVDAGTKLGVLVQIPTAAD